MPTTETANPAHLNLSTFGRTLSASRNIISAAEFPMPARCTSPRFHGLNVGRVFQDLHAADRQSNRDDGRLGSFEM